MLIRHIQLSALRLSTTSSSPRRLKVSWIACISSARLCDRSCQSLQGPGGLKISTTMDENHLRLEARSTSINFIQFPHRQIFRSCSCCSQVSLVSARSLLLSLHVERMTNRKGQPPQILNPHIDRHWGVLATCNTNVSSRAFQRHADPCKPGSTGMEWEH